MSGPTSFFCWQSNSCLPLSLSPPVLPQDRWIPLLMLFLPCSAFKAFLTSPLFFLSHQYPWDFSPASPVQVPSSAQMPPFLEILRYGCHGFATCSTKLSAAASSIISFFVPSRVQIKIPRCHSRERWISQYPSLSSITQISARGKFWRSTLIWNRKFLLNSQHFRCLSTSVTISPCSKGTNMWYGC